MKQKHIHHYIPVSTGSSSTPTLTRTVVDRVFNTSSTNGSDYTVPAGSALIGTTHYNFPTAIAQGDTLRGIKADAGVSASSGLTVSFGTNVRNLKFVQPIFQKLSQTDANDQFQLTQTTGVLVPSYNNAEHVDFAIRCFFPNANLGDDNYIGGTGSTYNVSLLYEYTLRLFWSSNNLTVLSTNYNYFFFPNTGSRGTPGEQLLGFRGIFETAS